MPFLTDRQRLGGFFVSGLVLATFCAVELIADISYATRDQPTRWPSLVYAVSTACLFLACFGLAVVYGRALIGVGDSPLRLAWCYVVISSTFAVGCLLLWPPIVYFLVRFGPPTSETRGPWAESIYVVTTACFNLGATFFLKFTVHNLLAERSKALGRFPAVEYPSLLWMVCCASWFSIGCICEITADLEYAVSGNTWPDWFYVVSTSGFFVGATLFALLNWDAHRARERASASKV
jgi:hypothetical protein